MRHGAAPAVRRDAAPEVRRDAAPAVERAATRPRIRAWLATLLVLLLAWSGAGSAATLTIDAGDDPDARLELRRTRLPDGTEVELIVLTGTAIRVTVDDLEIVGDRIEIDVGGRLVRVIGAGSFTAGDERLEGVDLELRLDEERVRAIDAIVFTSAIDVRGELADRLPGQLTFSDGLASPCSRCGQEVFDYAFRAGRMVLYPGDRLVGHDVTVLVRDVAVLRLPLLVIPLARGDRQPLLSVASGDAVRRAEVQLRWPYVAGSRSLGTFTVRYLADVDPAAASGIAGRVLGGATEVSYLGFELDHRMIDDLGSGSLRVRYDPGRVAREATVGVPARAETPARWTVRFAYGREEAPGEPALSAELLRSDERTPGRWVVQATVSSSDADALAGLGVRARFDTQTFVDTDTEVGRRTPPPYADRRTPWTTALRLRLEPLDLAPLRLDRLRVVSLGLDLGVFEDVANPINRRAAARGLVGDGRALLGHQLVLDPWAPWPGARLEGDNRFEGRYYAGGERAVTWRSRLALTQAFGEVGTATLAYTREVEEGETPFRFDAAVARARAGLRFGVQLRPAPWLGLSSEGGYLLVENRRPETVGWEPLTTRLTLFADRGWIDASITHRWDLPDDDPGTLRLALSLQGRRGAADLRVSLDHLQDLLVEDATPRVAETVTRFTWRAAVERWVAADVTTAYRPLPAPDAEGRVRAFEPLDVRVALGSTRAGDERPGLQVQALIDVEESELERIDVALRARVGPVELEASERIVLPEARATDARLTLTWERVARLEARGLVWLPPAWFGEPAPPAARQLSVQLREQRERLAGRWEVAWRTTVDPALEPLGRRDTRFEVRVALLQERWGPWLVSVEGSGEWSLADDRQPEPFLRRASLLFGVDAWERIGVQGRLGYLATYDVTAEELRRSELTISELTLAVRASDELLLGARLNDVWELTGTDAARSPWTVRPEVFFVWDRCCWALAGSWNAATGAVRIVLTGPGGEPGLEQVLDTDWTLPRAPLRQEDAGGGTP